MNAQDKALAIAQLADELKAQDIAVLNVADVCNFADYFVLATCTATTQMRALGHKIQRSLRDLGERAFTVSGYDSPNWIAQDYGDVIAHILSPEARQYYSLERLWADATRVDWHAAVATE